MEKEIIDNDDYGKCFESENFFKSFIKTIRNYPILSREEEKELIIKAHNNSLEAKRKLVEYNLRLVISIAKKYFDIVNIDNMDLIQEGTLGLIRAIEKYDVNMNCRLCTYAYYYIFRDIRFAVHSKTKMIRLPMNIDAEVVRFIQEKLKYENELGREVTIEELAKHLKMPYSKAIKLYLYSVEPFRIEENFGSSKTLGEVIETNDSMIVDEISNKEMPERIKELLENSKLKKREIDIIREYLGIDKESISFEKIGKKHGISREGARQIYINAMDKLRELPYIDEYRELLFDNDKELRITKRRNR